MVGHLSVMLDVVILFAEVVGGGVEEWRRRIRGSRGEGEAAHALRVVWVRHGAALVVGLGGAGRGTLFAGVVVAVEGRVGLGQGQARLRLREELGGIWRAWLSVTQAVGSG